MNTAQTDYKNLKAALLDLGAEAYNTQRAELIERLGYDAFRNLQNEVFKEIGTLQFEQKETAQ